MDSVKVTTRIPAYLKEALDKEAQERHMTLQQLFILKLSLSLSQPTYTPELSDQVSLILERVSKLALDVEKLTEPATASQPDNASQPETPQPEAEGLSIRRDVFMARYMLDDKAYGEAVLLGRDGYWVSPQNERWSVAGKGKTALWQLLA